MKKTIPLLVMLGAAFSVGAAPYVAGDFNGWDPAGNTMTETSAGSGIWQLTLDLSGRHEFKITDGTWDWSVPGANSWLNANGLVTITYDSNAYSDGWAPGQDRIGVSADAGTWTAVGNWQGWDNANALTAMAPLGGGVYKYSQVLAPGAYEFKAVSTGIWDAIGADGRTVNAATWAFSTTESESLASFYVNALDGSVKVEVTAVPEPASLGILGLGGLLMALRRRV